MSERAPNPTLLNHASEITAAAILFITLAWISVIARCSVRIFMNHLFRIDDWLAVATLLSFTVYDFFVLIGAAYGTGHKRDSIPDHSYQESLKWWYCGEITYAITTCLLKVSIGAFLLQICIHKAQTRIIWGMMTIFSLYSVYYVFVMAFQCHPVSTFWLSYHNFDPVGATTGGHCNHQNVVVASTYAHGVLSAVVDWTLGIMPIFLVWNLQMNKRTKISVAFILAFGAIGSLATIIRMPYISKLANSSEFLYENTGVSVWSTVEPGMGITASSMACLRPLFKSCLNASRHLHSDHYFGSSSWAPPPNVRIPRNIYSNIEEVGLNDVSSNASHIPSQHLPKNPKRAIYVTTVVKTRSARESFLDLESGMGTMRDSKSPSVLTSMDGWTETSGDISATSDGAKGRIEPKTL